MRAANEARCARLLERSVLLETVGGRGLTTHRVEPAPEKRGRTAHDIGPDREDVVGMGVRAIQLRRRARCRSCRAELWTGETAYFDDVTRRVLCRGCAMGDRPPLPLEGLRDSEPAMRSGAPDRAERERVRALIADARAALAGTKRAS